MLPLQLQPGPAGREHTRASELSMQMCMCSACGVRVLVALGCPRRLGVLMSALMNWLALSCCPTALRPAGWRHSHGQVPGRQQCRAERATRQGKCDVAGWSTDAMPHPCLPESVRRSACARRTPQRRSPDVQLACVVREGTPPAPLARHPCSSLASSRATTGAAEENAIVLAG